MSQIIHGDCLEVMKQIPDSSIDLILTDPPYDIHAKSGGGLHTKRQWLKNVHEADIDHFTPEIYFYEMVRVLKTVNMYIFCSKNLLPNYLKLVEKYNWELLIYSKTNPIPTKNNKYLSDKEYCIFIRESGAYFNNDLPYREYFTVQNISVSESKFHPAEKDCGYIEMLIRKSTKAGDIVLDPFMGSGTTCIAAHNLQREYIGIELEEKYFQMAQKRLYGELFMGVTK